MARRVAPWEIPDLQNYDAGPVQAVQGGAIALNRVNLNTMWDYQPESEMMDFLSSDANVGDDQDWEMVRPLGEGTFGKVGLWSAVRADGSIADEIAIKQVNRTSEAGDREFDLGTRPGLTTEAVLQHQVNGRNCENIVHLRHYKFYADQQKYRFYAEYCPHGDLERLRIRYRAKAARLPELFLWHLFHSLARAVSAMQGPWTHPFSGRAYPEDHHMLHMDLKLENVFLGYERQSIDTSQTSSYPTIKIGDFGLAAITGPEDNHNPEELWHVGTDGWKPPEQRHFGIEWQTPPNHGRQLLRSDETGLQVPFQRIPADVTEAHVGNWFAACKAAEVAGFKFSSEQNVWGAGKIVLDMMNLGEAEYYDEMLDAGVTEERYKANKPEGVPKFNRADFPEYNPGLLDLVEQCLRLEKYLRPTPADLVNLTDTGLRVAHQELQMPDLDAEQGTARTPRVYFKENEINEMPQGNAKLRYHPGEWRRLFSGFQNPDWENFIPGSIFRNKAMRAEPGAVRSPRRVRPRPFRFDDGRLITPWNIDDQGRIVFENGGEVPAPAPGYQDTEAYPHTSYCNGECGNRCADAATALRSQEQRRAATRVSPQGLQQQSGSQQQPRQDTQQPQQHSQQQLQQQVQQQPPAVPNSPFRTEAEYRKLRIQDLEEDLRGHRGVVPATVVGRGTHKENLIARAMQEDQNGNLGRGPVRGAGPTLTRAGKKRKRPGR